MLTLTETTARETPPAGAHAARCCLVADLGSQPVQFDGESRLVRKLLLSFELAEKRADGSAFVVSRRFTASLNERAALRTFLRAWRGKDFTPDELQSFELPRLLGAPAMVTLIETERAGRQYVDIAGISPLPKGLAAPALADPGTVFDIDDPAAGSVFEALSPKLREVIARSPEWQARKAPPGAILADLDDDIPF
ncbi:MAG: hypothetical protein FAZ92_03028 [Accumulibacter sp.]|uniref:phage replication initiation protein, NGO0469 family n=1 Tax=Accumulibacter sp. TaxID=2053492 RepID=UPI0012102552|nr:hypothetical protein [Accumulibacter sp.]QKS29536.1 MAG: hypothetical protein HT579_11855 [Candidatus Accumulibacter similis]TLD44716.1 MAG: hypothetical protein FAZ92_03028 [Accumulibacter sp.]